MTLVFFFISSFIASILSFNFSQQPFEMSPDMAISQRYEKRLEVANRDQLGFVYYTARAMENMKKINESELLSFTCTDAFIRTPQGVYALESAKTTLGEKRRVQNESFIEFMRNKEPDLGARRILSARVCELSDKTILLFYTTGIYDTKDADYQTPRLIVLNSIENEAFLQIISPRPFVSPGKIFKIKESQDHTRCDRPFQITKNGILYVLCEEKQDFASSFFVLRINLMNGKQETLEKCVNKFQNGIETSCN